MCLVVFILNSKILDSIKKEKNAAIKPFLNSTYYQQ